jgi:oligoendopeptidase F
MPDMLPIWDLTDLYADSSGSIQLDLDVAKRQTELLVQHEGHLSHMTGSELATVIADYQSLSERLSRVISHADLQFAADMADPQTGQHAQGIKEVISGLSSQLLFIELELATLDENRFQQALSDPDFYHFLPWLRRLRAFAPHQLETRLEQMLVERAPAGRGAWVRLFDETATALRFAFQGAEVTEAEILNKLSDPSADIRKEAGQSLSGVMQDNQRLFSLILNAIAKDKEIDDRWRGFNRPVSSRNLANDVDDATVDALAGAVTARMPDIAHRYYKLKAGWMGADKLPWWDRNAPLPGDDNGRFNWSDARQIVTDAFAGFDKPMAEVAQQFFDRNWIDAEVRQGKASGAFSHPTVPSAHPYILMNFDGRARDVMTLAHEMGHGIHQVLAADKGYLMSDTPLTLAETASVFAEMLTFQTLVDKAPNDAARRFLLAGKIEDMLNTVVRQIAFHNFETAFHDARKSGEVSSETLSDLWMQTQTQALGPAVHLDDSYRPIWAYIPHFVHTPFYVYAYAFGDCLVNALWQDYQVKSAADKPVFAEQYIQLLKAGGTKRYDEALAPFELNPADASFWNLGLDMIAGMIDELERLS